MRVRSLGQEDPLEEGMTTHSSILAWRIPWTEKSGRLQSMGSQRVGLSEYTCMHCTIGRALVGPWDSCSDSLPACLRAASRGRAWGLNDQVSPACEWPPSPGLAPGPHGGGCG